INTMSLNIPHIKGKMGHLGEFNGNLNIKTSEDYGFKSRFDLKDVKIKRIYNLLKPFIKEDLREVWDIDGQCMAKLELQGYFKDENPYLSGFARIDLKEGSFTSQDALKAGQGIRGIIELELGQGQILKKKSKLTTQNKLTIYQGEYLYNNFYLNQKDRQLNINFKLTSDFTGLTDIELITDLFSTANYQLKLTFINDKINVNSKVKDLQFDKFHEYILKDSINTIYPFTKDMVLHGNLNFSIEGIISDSKLRTHIELSDGYVYLPLLDLTIRDLMINTPFYINQQADENESSIKFSELNYKGLVIKDISLPLMTQNNKLVLNNNIEFDFLQGKAKLQNLDVSLTNKMDFNLKTSIDLKDAKTSLLTELLGFGAFGGSLDAKISELEFIGSNIYSDSIIQADVFGGQIEMTNINGNLNTKTFGADIRFKEIDLEKLTETIKIGKITGIVEGSLMDFQIQYGQAARFHLDIDSVKRDGVKQVVSTDAVESISILGTGAEGISRLLSTGINQFFKEFPYSKIGIKCILDNDVFTIRGKILEGGREYLIRKGFLRGIDVVNQNPDNQISFKDMQKRLNIIFDQKQVGLSINPCPSTIKII
ncbi:MAG: hypothetical protein N2738_06460, partial [Thermodesulfovibrionales bacterium]|nr:hypothetical protein [Thermodesulfovibrionales bacterium]